MLKSKEFSDKSFLEYCLDNSKNGGLFHIDEVNRICKMAGYQIYDINDSSLPKHLIIKNEEMEQIINRIEIREY